MQIDFYWKAFVNIFYTKEAQCYRNFKCQQILTIFLPTDQVKTHNFEAHENTSLNIQSSSLFLLSMFPRMHLNPG